MVSHILPVYPRAPMEIVRGEGVWLYDTAGQRYLDCMSGIAVNALGHCHPQMIAALTEQAQKLWHLSNFFRIPGQEELAALMCAHSFADQVFFTNSGVEAWECGIKIIRKAQSTNGHPERWRMIGFQGCFHGRTLAAIAASKAEKMVKGFGPMVEGFDQVPFGDLAAIEAAITPETAGIHLEPIMGEGGLRPWPEDDLCRIRALCDEYGLLLLFDEIQCGAGRSGKLWAHEWAGITPDVMSTAKGIGGGFPMGACLATAEAARGMTLGTHGTTFGGNPLAMAVGRVVMETLTGDGFLEHVNAVAAYAQQGLAELVARHPQVFVEWRGKGLMLGLRMAAGCDRDAFLLQLAQAGLLSVGATTDMIRLVPPLIITPEQIDFALERLDAVATQARSSAA